MNPHEELSGPIKAESSCDKIQEFYQLLRKSYPFESPDEKVSLEFKGHRNESDIKWNAMTGTLVLKSPEGIKKKGYHSLFSAKIQPFTGNCGIKAISHLWIFTNYSEKSGTLFQEQSNLALHLLEDFLYHHTNAGMLVASDHVHGFAFKMIQTGGANWNSSESVWNPNYTWDTKKTHKVQLMWKILDAKDYPNYFGTINYIQNG